MKYGNGMRIYEAYELELQELKNILREYNIPGEVEMVIVDMFTEPYYQWNEACACARALERVLGFKDKFDAEKFQEYLLTVAEEKERYPFRTSVENGEYNDEE